MSKYQIAVIFGGLRKESFNRTLANAIIKLAPSEFDLPQFIVPVFELAHQAVELFRNATMICGTVLGGQVISCLTFTWISLSLGYEYNFSQSMRLHHFSMRLDRVGKRQLPADHRA